MAAWGVAKRKPRGRQNRSRSERAADESGRVPFQESTQALLQSLAVWYGRIPGVPLRGTRGSYPARLRRLRAHILGRHQKLGQEDQRNVPNPAEKHRPLQNCDARYFERRQVITQKFLLFCASFLSKPKKFRTGILISDQAGAIARQARARR